MTFIWHYSSTQAYSTNLVASTTKLVKRNSRWEMIGSNRETLWINQTIKVRLVFSIACTYFVLYFKHTFDVSSNPKIKSAGTPKWAIPSVKIYFQTDKARFFSSTSVSLDKTELRKNDKLCKYANKLLPVNVDDREINKPIGQVWPSLSFQAWAIFRRNFKDLFRRIYYSHQE